MQNRKPMMLVFAGPNGSGKSTITPYFGTVGEYTNADDIVAATGASNKEATISADERRKEAIKEQRDLTFETVLSSEYKMEIIRLAKKNDYFIKCVFVLTANPELNVLRVRSRVETGGHDVPKEKIFRRYKKSLKNIPELIEICDILHVYDNTGGNPIRIFRKHKDEPYKIYPNEYWSEEQIRKMIFVGEH